MSELERTELFATPVWTIELEEFVEDLPAMASVARRVLAEFPASPGDPLTQSRAVLQESSYSVWTRFFELLASIMGSIAGRDLPPRYSHGDASLRSWVMEVSDPADWWRVGSTTTALHSHLPAALSSVFYVEVPPEIIGASTGGTTFRDPNSIATAAYRRISEHVPAVPGRLVVFPGWLEHLPEPPDPNLGWSGRRLIVSTDLRINAT